MTEEFVKVDLLRRNMIDIASGVDIEMGQYAGSWRGASEQKSRQFRFALKRLGRAVDLAFIGGELCWYNGKIYERIEKQTVRNAYTDMIDHFQLNGWIITNRLFFEDSFMRSVRESKSYELDLGLFAFSNGVLDLRGGKVEFCDFGREFPVMKMHDFRYRANADCPKWSAFLREVLPDKAQRVLLQMSMGLGLCNRDEIGTVEQCLVLYGAGGNGKGVVYRMMHEIFGSELMSCVSVRDLCSPSDNGLRARYELRGKIFNWNSDENSDFLKGVDPAVFKRIVSGEPVNDRKIGGDIGENKRLPYMAFNTNFLPRMGELTDAMMRRWQVVSFGVSIDDKRVNPDLGNELMNERSGIFNWILRGMKEFRRRRYRMPVSEASERAKLRMTFEQNPVKSFIDAYGIRTKARVRGEVSSEIPKKYLLERLNEFVSANGSDKVYGAESMGWGLRNYCNDKMKVPYTQPGGVMCYRLYGVTKESLKKVLYIGECSGEKYVYENGSFIGEED